VAELYTSLKAKALLEENNLLRQQLHDHNGMCQRKLSEQLTEILPDIKSKDERIKELTEALDEIRYPVKYIRMRAEQQGAQLNGIMAVQLSESHHHLKEIAARVLDKASLLNSSVTLESSKQEE
jgi:hypothetical protein